MARSKKKFHKVNLEISNICNLQCSFCPPVEREKKMMSLDLFQKILPQIAPLTELVCLHLMGEPLTHPQLKQIIDECDKNQTKIFFVTNGILIREDKFNLLLHPIIYQVNFSLHSFFDNFPGKDPTSYLEKIFDYTELALKNRPDLFINYRLWNLNDTRGSETDNTNMLQKIEDRFDFTAPSSFDLKAEKSFKIKNRLYLHFDTEFTWPSLSLPPLGDKGSCYGLSGHFGIHADGTVVPCCLDKEADIPLGNANESDINEILNSERAQKILKGFQENKLTEDLCKRCQYIERFK